jgi:predicted transposase/invertase (TIGR01784 family)
MSVITPRIDIAFKKIFGVEENKDLLISLLNSIVSKEDEVADVTLLNPYNLKSFRTDKLSILDVKARGTNGKLFNIEIQISDEADYDKRALYYWAKLYTEQLKNSEGYSNLSKAIGIHILNFLSIPESDKYHNVFHIIEKENGIAYFKDLELHTIELNKFTKGDDIQATSDIVTKVKNSLDMWVAFLTKNDLLDPDNLPKPLDDPNLKKALEVLEVMNFNTDERETYEGRIKWMRMEISAIKKREEEVKEEKAIEIARRMLAKGKPIDEIIEFTELTKEQIETL